MSSTTRFRPFTVWLLFYLILIMGIGSLISGPMLFLEPNGSFLNWTVEQLEGTPFSNYLIPGLVLFIFIGVYPVFVAWSLIRKPAFRWPDAINPFKRYHWVWAASWSAGIIMLIWIAVEILIIGYIGFLQPMVAVWGIVIIALSFLPDVRRYCRRT